MTQDTSVTITMSLNECNIALNALAAQPFNQVVDLITKIKMQAEAQLAAAQAPAAPEVVEN